jgi:hypothetical protein
MTHRRSLHKSYCSPCFWSLAIFASSQILVIRGTFILALSHLIPVYPIKTALWLRILTGFVQDKGLLWFCLFRKLQSIWADLSKLGKVPNLVNITAFVAEPHILDFFEEEKQFQINSLRMRAHFGQI